MDTLERSAKKSMDPRKLVSKLKEKFNCTKDSDLCRELGMKQATLAQWKNRDSLSELQIANAMIGLRGASANAVRNGIADALSSAISALVEYAPIAPLNKAGAKGVQIKTRDGYGHLNLRATLEGQHGIYIFYSSLGRPIYVGKAKDTELWGEANSAFGRDLKKKRSSC